MSFVWRQGRKCVSYRMLRNRSMSQELLMYLDQSPFRMRLPSPSRPPPPLWGSLCLCPTGLFLSNSSFHKPSTH